MSVSTSGLSGAMKVEICSLPNELLRQIYSYLPPQSLGFLAQTCKRLAEVTLDDSLWQYFVRHLRLTSPAPYVSYRQLYLNLHQHLYLAPHIWFSTQRWGGSLYVFRYNPRTGNIEGVPLVGRREYHGSGPEFLWDETRSRSTAIFKRPKVQCVENVDKVKIICNGDTYNDWETGLMMDKCTGERWQTADEGVISIGRARRKRNNDEDEVYQPPGRWDIQDSPRPVDEGDHSAAGAQQADFADDGPSRLEDDHDRTIWPPTILPSREAIKLPIAHTLGEYHHQHGLTPFRQGDPRRTRRAREDPHPTVDWELSNLAKLPRVYTRTDKKVSLIPPDHPSLPYQEPPRSSLDEQFATDTFYLYKSMGRVVPSNRPGIGTDENATAPKSEAFRALEIYTKVHPSLYWKQNTHSSRSASESTSQQDIDLSGIWLGDYFAHGAEFLLFHHPNKSNNRLEAIKLTGDNNVPRGEYTLIVPNLTRYEGNHSTRGSSAPGRFETGSSRSRAAIPSSFVRLGRTDLDGEELDGRPFFAGKGQVAHHGFSRRAWSELELIILDEGKEPEKNFGEIQVFWKMLRHVSRARKVDVERILFGYLYPSPRTVEEKMSGSGEKGEGIVYATDGGGGELLMGMSRAAPGDRPRWGGA